MAKTIEVSGQLTITPDACVSGSGQTVKELGLGAPGCCGAAQNYPGSVCEGVDLATGVAGATFQAIASLAALTEIFLLYIRTSAAIVLRLYAVPATALATSGTYPTGYGGGETLITTIDGVAVTTAFDVLDQTLLQVVARINAGQAFAGIATPRASAVSGQLQIDGVMTRVNGTQGVLSFAGTGMTEIGMDTVVPVDALGQDIDINGLYIQEFPRTGNVAPTAAQISGTATVDIVAAGATT